MKATELYKTATLHPDIYVNGQVQDFKTFIIQNSDLNLKLNYRNCKGKNNSASGSVIQYYYVNVNFKSPFVQYYICYKATNSTIPTHSALYSYNTFDLHVQ